MTRTLSWLLLGFLLMNLPSLEAEEKGKLLFIDSRLLLIAQPLFQAFDPATRRFRETPSDPSLIRKIGKEGVKKKIEELRSRKHALTKSWQEKISKATAPEVKKLEKEFIQERKVLEKELELLKGQQAQVQVDPEKPAYSMIRSILPSVNEIAGNIKQTLLELKEKYQADLVLDIAPLFPRNPVDVDTKILYGFSPGTLWMTKNAKFPPTFGQWIQEAKNYWTNNDIFSSPVMYGGTDCRLEAMEIIKEAKTNQW